MTDSEASKIRKLQERYQQDAIKTAPPRVLLVMIYDKLLDDLNEAETAMEKGDCFRANQFLLHAQEIVITLRNALRIELWDGAPRLSGLYNCIYGELVAANMKKDVEKVRWCRAHIEKLAEAWRQAAAQAPMETPFKENKPGNPFDSGFASETTRISAVG
jgi:flagellar protein FliS